MDIPSRCNASQTWIHLQLISYMYLQGLQEVYMHSKIEILAHVSKLVKSIQIITIILYNKANPFIQISMHNVRLYINVT